MIYGLVGERLGHSFSKIIHERLADYVYDLMELTEEELARFMTDKAFRAVNVTVPYKEKVIPFLDEMDPHARQIGAVNTVINCNGVLKGYNTDYPGFAYMLERFRIDVKGKKVLLLGAGGSGKAVQAVLADRGAGEIVIAATKARGKVITYFSAAEGHRDAEIIVNTTPVGMYPHLDDSPADLNDFPACKAVVDIIYNPLKTTLMLQAEEKGVLSAGGLVMLVAQAKYAVELFIGGKLPDDGIEEIIKILTEEKSNIVLTGMPGSGKTTVGKILREKTGRELVDTDKLIVSEAGRSIRKIFDTDGEAYFRELERGAVRGASLKSGCIIATGGGVIKDGQNMERLKHNGIIVFLDRPPEDLITEDPSRPLCTGSDAVLAMFRERYDLYCRYAHIRIQSMGTVEETAEEVIKQYHIKIREGW